MNKLILASNSPRRHELLKGLDLDFEVRVKKGVGEKYPDNLPAEKVPEYISKEKAAAYDIKEDETLLTADTVVILNGEIMGKPKDASEAKDMLRKLSGHTHHVVTGVSITTRKKQVSFSDTTAVTFRDLTDSEIDYYIEHYKPFDKAGAYGVQEWIGYIGVTRIEGSFYNVMGLPVERVYEALKAF
jgi:septum formation protein